MNPYYQDDYVTIFNGDCREILPTLPKVDLCLTDPPYLLSNMGGGGAFGDRDHIVNTKGFTDMGTDLKFLSNYKSWFCFCSFKQIKILLEFAENCDRANLLTWCKTNPVPTVNNKYLPDIEYIVHAFEKKRLFGGYENKSCFHLYPCGNKISDHPNEKPLPVIKRLVVLGTIEGEVIIDPFAGSCTTGVAAKELNRKAILIEIEEKYCEIGAKRCSQEVFNFGDLK